MPISSSDIAHGRQSLQGKRVLITGGTGFIGSNLVRRCVELGAKVRVVARTLERASNLDGITDEIELVRGDVCKYEDMSKAVQGADIVFHLAAQTSHHVASETPVHDVEVNCIGTLNVLEAVRARAPEARVLMTGTVTAAGPAAVLPANEDQPCSPVNIYDANKLVCEKYMAIYGAVHGIHTVTLRLANVFGERQQLNNPQRGILNYMMGRAILGEPITVYGDGSLVRDYSYVSNIVDACMAAVEHDSTHGNFYVIGSGRGMAFRDMAAAVNDTVQEVFGRNTTIDFVPFPESEKKLDAGDFIADTACFSGATGWRPSVSFEDGLLRTAQFYRDCHERYI